MFQVLICNYGPTGNAGFQGEWVWDWAENKWKWIVTGFQRDVYKEGQPGTECPAGTQALQSGLCEKYRESKKTKLQIIRVFPAKYVTYENVIMILLMQGM